MQTAGDALLNGAPDAKDGPQFSIGIGGEMQQARKEKKRTKDRERRERKRRETQEAKDAARAAALEAGTEAPMDEGNVDPQPETPSTAVKISMPVDPNEPLYCYCRQVSWGEVRPEPATMISSTLMTVGVLCADDWMR